MEFMYLAFTCMPGESYRKQLRSLLLCLCDSFQALINSLVCWLGEYLTIRFNSPTLPSIISLVVSVDMKHHVYLAPLCHTKQIWRTSQTDKSLWSHFFHYQAVFASWWWCLISNDHWSVDTFHCWSHCRLEVSEDKSIKWWVFYNIQKQH